MVVAKGPRAKVKNGLALMTQAKTIRLDKDVIKAVQGGFKGAKIERMQVYTGPSAEALLAEHKAKSAVVFAQGIAVRKASLSKDRPLLTRHLCAALLATRGKLPAQGKLYITNM